jgi:hypothetical protein
MAPRFEYRTLSLGAAENVLWFDPTSTVACNSSIFVGLIFIEIGCTLFVYVIIGETIYSKEHRGVRFWHGTR